MGRATPEWACSVSSGTGTIHTTSAWRAQRDREVHGARCYAPSHRSAHGLRSVLSAAQRCAALNRRRSGVPWVVRRRSNVLRVRFEGLNVHIFGDRNPLLVRDVLLYRQDGTACGPDTREDGAGAVTSGVATFMRNDRDGEVSPRTVAPPAPPEHAWRIPCVSS